MTNQQAPTLHNNSPSMTLINEPDINANLTVTPHLTLKMTAAEAVETSVTTTNSLSQDFTNLDDQPSQTLKDTPGFIPFTLY